MVEVGQHLVDVDFCRELHSHAPLLVKSQVIVCPLRNVVQGTGLDNIEEMGFGAWLLGPRFDVLAPGAREAVTLLCVSQRL